MNTCLPAFLPQAMVASKARGLQQPRAEDPAGNEPSVITQSVSGGQVTQEHEWHVGF